jgi:peptidoglycan/LPS O-acetylase OafA/YrhL
MKTGCVADATQAHGLLIAPARAAGRVEVEEPRGGRIQTVDAARFVALLGIVFIHTVESPELAPYAAIGTFQVPFFVFLSLYFQVRSFRGEPQRPLGAYAWGRIQRLYTPFLAWSVIYLVARNLKKLLLDQGAWVTPQWCDAICGTAHHLWFLPFLTVIAIAFAGLNRLGARYPMLRAPIAGAAVLAGLMLVTAPRPQWLNQPSGAVYCLFQAWRALPSAFLGLGVAWILSGMDLRTPFARGAGIAGLFLTAGAVFSQIRFGYSRPERTLSGLGWALVALSGWHRSWVPHLAALGKYAYGAYLSHVLVIETVQALAHSAGVGPSVALDAFTFAMGVAGAFWIAIVLGRHRRLAWLNG